MDSFFRTHKYLVEHVTSPVKRELMQEINWNSRLIGIKGSRGVGKTTFLLECAKERGRLDHTTLYINLNNFYFTECTLIDFAGNFYANGGRILLIDQVYKYPNWSEELRYCYDHYPALQIIFSGSTVMRLKEANPQLYGLVDSYNLRGFSFREYLNLTAGTHIPSVKLEYLLENHRSLAQEICETLHPLDYFQDYLHHGFYPFFLEKRNFSENLLKTMNMTLEVDVLSLKQIELSYLPKLRKLLYILAMNAPYSPNMSLLSKEIQTSRATVVNYIQYLKDARLINALYVEGDEFPKKPAKIYLHNTNLMYPIRPQDVEQQAVRETFFYNTLHKDNKLNKGERNMQFIVNGQYHFSIQGDQVKGRINPQCYYTIDAEIGRENIIPLWMFGLLY